MLWLATLAWSPLVSLRGTVCDQRYKDSRFKIQDSRFKIQDSTFKIQDSIRTGVGYLPVFVIVEKFTKIVCYFMAHESTICVAKTPRFAC